MQSTKLAIESDGAIVMIYDDDDRELIDAGAACIARVSDVEPNENGEWLAIMRRDSVVLGPFRLRSEALAAEVKYLQAQLF